MGAPQDTRVCSRAALRFVGLMLAYQAVAYPSTSFCQPIVEPLEQQGSKPSAAAAKAEMATRLVITNDGLYRRRTQVSADGTEQVIQETPLTPLGVFIELQEPPLVAAKTAAQSEGGATVQNTKDRVAEAERRLDAEQARVGAELESAFGGRADTLSSAKPGTRPSIEKFRTAFNGFAVRGVSVAQASAKLAGVSGIKIHPIHPVSMSLDTSVDFIRVPSAWNRKDERGRPIDGTGVTIGVVDTGVDYKHPDLGGCFGRGCRVVGGYDVVNNDSDPMDDQGHGTHVAATAAGLGSYKKRNGTTGLLPGVAPGATLYAFKVLSAKGSGDDSSVLGGIERCIDPNGDGNFDDRVDVCTMSLGGPGNPDSPLSRAVDFGSAHGTVFTIAAGNAGPQGNTIGDPGSARSAITVGAACEPGIKTDYCTGPIAEFSSRGPIEGFPDVRKPDIAAPGVRICAARASAVTHPRKICFDRKHMLASGTSMATPHVAGVAALLLQANPSLSAAQVKAIIMETATDLKEPHTTQGAGLVDVRGAINAVSFQSRSFRFFGAPILLEYTPQLRQQEFKREIRIQNISRRSRTIAPPLKLEQEGISLRFREPSLELAPGEVGAFHVTVTVDHAQIPSSATTKRTFTLLTPEEELSLDVVAFVGSRLRLSSGKVTFGTVDPARQAYSAERQVRITNTIKDVPLELTASRKCCTFVAFDGAEAETKDASFGSGPKTITIPAGGSVTVAISSSLDMAKAKNGEYRGTIFLSSPQERVKVMASVVKAYEVPITFPGALPASLTLVSSQDDKIQVTEQSSMTAVQVPRAGTWGVSGIWAEVTAQGRLRLSQVVKRIEVGSSTPALSLDPQESAHSIRFQPTDWQGKAIRNPFVAWTINPRGLSPAVPLAFEGSDLQRLDYSINSLDSTFVLTGVAMPAKGNAGDPAAVLHLYHHATGISSDLTLKTGTPQPLFVMGSSPRQGQGPARFSVAACLPDSFQDGMPTRQLCQVGTTAFQRSNRPGAFSVATYETEDPSRVAYPDLPFVSIVAEESPDYLGINGPLLFPSSRGLVAWIPVQRPILPRLSPSTYYKQLRVETQGPRLINLQPLPLIDSSRWYNVGASTNLFVPTQGEGVLSYGGSAFSQSLTEHALEFLRDETPIPSTSYSGQFFLEPFFPQGTSTRLLRLPIPGAEYQTPTTTPPGRYTQVLSHFFLGDEFELPVESRTSFTIPTEEEHRVSPRDENPPSIESMHLLVKGIWQSVVDPRQDNTLAFKLNPNPGLGARDDSPGVGAYHIEMPDGLASVTLEQSSDTKTWRPIALRELGDYRYEATIDATKDFKIYYFRLSARDLAGNDLLFSFSMPQGSAQPPPPDLTAPLVISISGIKEGELLPRTSQVRVNVENLAQAVRCVLIVNNKPVINSLGCNSNRPNTIDWKKIRKGPIKVKIRVDDVTGRTGMSPEISVTNRTLAKR